MSELGDDFRAMKEYKRKKREREGWISNRYKTEESRIESVQYSHELNERIDHSTLKEIKSTGIVVVRKSESSFQLQLPEGNVMFYSGKNGDFIYVAQTKQRIDVSYPLGESLLDAVKKINWSDSTPPATKGNNDKK
jgi:hypothetical protein